MRNNIEKANRRGDQLDDLDAKAGQLVLATVIGHWLRVGIRHFGSQNKMPLNILIYYSDGLIWHGLLQTTKHYIYI